MLFLFYRVSTILYLIEVWYIKIGDAVVVIEKFCKVLCQVSVDDSLYFHSSKMKNASEVGCLYHKKISELYHVLINSRKIHLEGISRNREMIKCKKKSVIIFSVSSISNHIFHQLKSVANLELLSVYPKPSSSWWKSCTEKFDLKWYFLAVFIEIYWLYTD